MNKLTIKINKKIAEKDRLLVGGKGLPLIDLKSKNIPIPSGFIVTTEAHGLFLKESNLDRDIKRLASHSKFKNIQTLIKRASMPDKLLSKIETELEQSRIESYAVRSSANVEDSSSNSWAGVFESYINIPRSKVIDHIKQCWASIFNPRAVDYSGSLSNLLSIRMAVIVQQSINCGVSGVCFTKDPLDDKKDDIRIEAVFGLGESLVQGEVTPDKYTVERERNIILKVFVNPQKIMHTFKQKSGTKTVQIKPTYKQKLSGKEIKDLAKLSQNIENFYNVGQDIEWCKKGNIFYIVQSRPIISNRPDQEGSE